jgi:uncharacterized protein
MNDTYLVDVAPIYEVLGESIAISDDIVFETFEVGTEEFIPTGPAHVDLTITNGGTAIVAMGRVSMPVLATCARCLCEFPTKITAEVDGFFISPGDEEGIPAEQEIAYIDENNRVDIMPWIIAALVLEAPFAPLHDEECAGICSVCGADLNEGECECQRHTEKENPFSALQGLLNDAPADGE